MYIGIEKLETHMSVRVQIEGVEIEGEMRTHKIWVSELSDDDRVTRIYEMAPPVSTQRFVLPAHFGQIPAV